MTRRAHSIASTAALLCLAGLVSLPATAAPAAGPPGATVASRVPDPTATTVRNNCTGGGRIISTVVPVGADGAYRVTVSSRFLPEGSRWDGALLAFDRRGEPQDHRFRRTVTDGEWHVSALFEPDPRRLKEFGILAVNRRELCLVILDPGEPTSAFSSCSQRHETALVARRQRDGGIKVRFLLSDERRDQHPWRVEVRVSGGGVSQSVTVNASTGPSGNLWSTTELRGIDEPRILVTATNERGRRCTLGLNPDQLGAAALPSRAELLRAIRDLRETAHQRP